LLERAKHHGVDASTVSTLLRQLREKELLQKLQLLRELLHEHLIDERVAMVT
jgi:predicted transcriptional regulator